MSLYPPHISELVAPVLPDAPEVPQQPDDIGRVLQLLEDRDVFVPALEFVQATQGELADPRVSVGGPVGDLFAAATRMEFDYAPAALADAAHVLLWLMHTRPAGKSLPAESAWLPHGRMHWTRLAYWPGREQNYLPDVHVVRFAGWDDWPGAYGPALPLDDLVQRGQWVGRAAVDPHADTPDGLPLDWFPLMTDSPLLEYIRVRHLGDIAEEDRDAGMEGARTRLQAYRTAQDAISGLAVSWYSTHVVEPVRAARNAARAALHEKGR